MYDVNRERIDRRLAFLAVVTGVVERFPEVPDKADSITRFAAERAVHLATECVTDIGSDLIDGFVMRDAGSLEDIIDILHGEQVFGKDLHAFLISLVKWRKPLVQNYDGLDAVKLYEMAFQLKVELPRYIEAVRNYLAAELEMRYDGRKADFGVNR